MDIAKPAHCPSCARPRTAADARGLEWSTHHGPDGTVSWLCGPCTRNALFEIETGEVVTRSSYPRSA
jgi:hypothetical protein